MTPRLGTQTEVVEERGQAVGRWSVNVPYTNMKSPKLRTYVFVFTLMCGIGILATLIDIRHAVRHDVRPIVVREGTLAAIFTLLLYFLFKDKR